ncbi:MAG: substrate-binding domain-containing protein [Kiritimatiellae bacterium]|nr:substrate-binding domain-containing protein [Kiritimatiellia bacterium]
MKSVLYFQSSINASNNSGLDGVRRYAKAAGWRVHVTPYADAAYLRGGHEDSARRPDVKGLLEFWNPCGVIVECGAARDQIDTCDFKTVPTVFLDRIPEGGETCVTSDAKPIAALAAKELLSLGFRTYAYVPFHERVRWSVERGEEFERLVRMNGCKFHLFRRRPFGDDSETYRAWLCEWLRKAPKPIGVFAACDYVAATVLSCAEREKIVVPGELAVIGVDNDLGTCEQTTPTLTSILLDHERAGYLAAQLLELKLEHPRRKVAGGLFGPVCVYHRQSTFVYSRSDSRVDVALKLIRRNACDGISSKEVIAEMGCSRRLAEMRFREVTGHSIMDEILSVRIERAKHLLEHSSKPVAQIAADCGYRSSNALRKVFEPLVGMTPRAWRLKSSH